MQKAIGSQAVVVGVVEQGPVRRDGAQQLRQEVHAGQT